jgi:methylated-DNA-protein-cysteine methyltransferase related protein
MSERAEGVLARIRAIPPGFVRTYGDVSPGAPRFAGSILREVDEPGLPWWRVVRADGSLAQGDQQRIPLLAEGVPFRGERVDMAVARIADR